ncbi:MAG: 2-oxoacid:acceptor oxidoreductase family protein [Deltaproteobacteria bacterium]|nr:2-oxoacid:acceptor oxidoreductase family protein [Deltaproteobacteria bacterium]
MTVAPTSDDLEIRLHGRGGQGGVTCAKIIAALYADLGKSVQTFGDYAGERSGAPVRAYTRVSDRPITNRNKVYEPHHLLVLDPTLLGDDVVAGLRPGGTLLLNTPEPPAAFTERFAGHRVATVDATAIARRHQIGTRSVVIVNTTIAGAFARALELPIAALEDAYRHLGFESNLPAAREAYDAVRIGFARKPEEGAASARAASPASRPEVLPLVSHVEGAPTGLRTGAWRTQLPRYTHHLAPCNAFCPAGNDVIGFVQALATKREPEAAVVLSRTTALAGVCGRVCPAFCMEGCNRREYDGSVNIRALERWTADRYDVAVREPAKAATPRKIAVVGGGPAGLSAAYELAKLGHAVVIHDGEQALGGVLHTGIPTYRLPREVLRREVEAVLALGVETRLGRFLDREGLAALALEHDAVIVATGLQRLRRLEVPGSGLGGIEQGIHFLHRLNVGGSARIGETLPLPQRGEGRGEGRASNEITGHVVVLGGGNTAMDCARGALRAGAASVTVAYRRSRAELPAIAEEVEAAEHEGVSFRFLAAPAGFVGDGIVSAVVLADVELGPADASGRRSPITTDRTFELRCDAVLLALGQSADLSLVPPGWTLRRGRFFLGEQPLSVFAAGDVNTGDGTVAHAIGDGRRAAALALRALGDDVVVPVRPDRATAVPATDIRFDHFARSAPTLDRLVPVPARLSGFDEVSLGLGDALESHRCFSCGECTRCDTCLVYCPEGIIRRKELGYEVDYTYCKGCGICVTECPRKAMEMSAS